MLNFTAAFWPLFWAIIGAGALVTVALSALIATISPAGFRPRRGHRPQLAAAELTGQAGPGYLAHSDTKAA